MPIVRRFIAAAVLALALAAPARAEMLSPPIARTPAEPRGTVVLLPAAGWSSPTAAAQRTIWSRMAPTLFRAGYRVVATDYERGAVAAMRSVRAVVRRERRRADGPLCLYGESSGGHLAAIAGYRLPAVDCVISFGAPFDFAALARDADAHPEELGYRNTMDVAIHPTFGTDPADWQGWEPARMLTPIPVPALAMLCADDPLVPASQVNGLPGAETFVVASGSMRYVHGTVSPASLKATRTRIRDFLARVVSGRRS